MTINHLTVIPADKIIIANGEGLIFDFAAPAALRALQWHEGAGHIEYNDDSPNRPLGTADYAAEVAPWGALWQAEKDRLEEEANKPPTPEEARATKLAEINVAFERAGANGRVMSSLGFEIDANERANRDTEGLITVMTATGMAKTWFCDYHNVMREVTLDGLKTLRLEIIAYGQSLYAQKWALREAVNAARSLEEIQALAWPEG